MSRARERTDEGASVERRTGRGGPHDAGPEQAATLRWFEGTAPKSWAGRRGGHATDTKAGNDPGVTTPDRKDAHAASS